MLYKIEIHSIDLQDHDGFLAFLNAHSRDGLEAVRVYRTFTVFKKTDAPPAGYSMRFFPDSDLMDADRIPGLQNGVEIRPVTDSVTTPDNTWMRTVIENYKTFTQNNFGLLISKVVRRLLIPAALFVILLAYGGELFHSSAQSLLAEFEGSSHVVFPLLVFAGILILVNAFLADLTSWAADNGEWRFTSAKRGETPKTLSRKAAPEPFLAEYGSPDWRENPDLKKSSLAEGGRWNPDKIGKKYRRWIERIKPETGLADAQIRSTEKSPLEKETDYREFVGAWCYANLDAIADGRVTMNNIPDFEAWEKLGCPMPRYLPIAKRYSKAGFQINGWQSYGLQRDYPLNGLDPDDPVYCSAAVTV